MDPRTPQGPQPAGTYSVAQSALLAEKSSSASGGHLLAAADYITRLFDANKVPFAFMGGFSMNIRGSPRETHDVDVAVGSDMNQLIAVVSAQAHRVLRPLGPVSGVMRIYLQVGGELGEDLSSKYVMVDLILRGGLGAPDHPENESEDVKVQTSLGERQFRLLNLRALLQSKLGAFFGRSGVNDMNDIRFLIQKNPEGVHSARAALNQEHRQHFINKLAAIPGVPKGELSKARLALAIAGPAALIH